MPVLMGDGVAPESKGGEVQRRREKDEWERVSGGRTSQGRAEGRSMLRGCWLELMRWLRYSNGGGCEGVLESVADFWWILRELRRSREGSQNW